MMDLPFVASPTTDIPITRAGSPAPSPLTLICDDPETAVRANARLTKKSGLSRLLSVPKLRRTPSSLSPQPSQDSLHQETPIDFTPISLDNSALAGEDTHTHTDRYEWAILYENQRGITVFSIPYYSSLSLLPSDPSPFTLPNSSLKRSEQPPVSLSSYPFPDGNWHWVSRCWMIDMRTDTGEVQHDGFEYNWFFRRHNWRAQVGSFNAGGWVRRRRWVRLMVRPGKPISDTPDGPPSSASASLMTSTKNKHRMSTVSIPPSILTNWTDPNVNWDAVDPDDVWLGDVEKNWQHCRRLMKMFGRDGRKLELWKLWLGFYHPEHKANFLEPGKQRDKQWTEDEQPLPSELTAADILSREYVSIAPRDNVIDVLRQHGQDMLRLFVFPESRAKFLQLLGQAGMLAELNVELGIGLGATEVDFWSYASGLAEAMGTNNISATGKQKEKEGES